MILTLSAAFQPHITPPVPWGGLEPPMFLLYRVYSAAASPLAHHGLFSIMLTARDPIFV